MYGPVARISRSCIQFAYPLLLRKESRLFSKQATPMTDGRQLGVGGKLHLMSSQPACAAVESVDVSARPRLPSNARAQTSARKPITIKSRSLRTDLIILLCRGRGGIHSWGPCAIYWRLAKLRRALPV